MEVKLRERLLKAWYFISKGGSKNRYFPSEFVGLYIENTIALRYVHKKPYLILDPVLRRLIKGRKRKKEKKEDVLKFSLSSVSVYNTLITDRRIESSRSLCLHGNKVLHFLVWKKHYPHLSSIKNCCWKSIYFLLLQLDWERQSSGPFYLWPTGCLL